MNSRIIFLVAVVFMTSCTSQKPVVRTTKKPANTNRTTSTSTSSRTSTAKPSVKPSVSSQSDSNETQVLEATTSLKVTTEVVLRYIDDFKDIAIENMRQHGIPASITLAQGILESGAGLGALSRRANNHFGIKCHKEWNGPSVRHDDDSEQECFRKYEHPSESYRDHSLFLTTRSRYSSLFALPSTDYVAWAKGLKAAGYATDSKYPDKLISLIERYKLYQFDIASDSATKNSNTAVSDKNSTTEYIVVKGDTLYSLSKKFNIPVSDLKKKNNLSSDSLSIGQRIRVR